VCCRAGNMGDMATFNDLVKATGSRPHAARILGVDKFRAHKLTRNARHTVEEIQRIDAALSALALAPRNEAR